jgi:AraC-like DNA-binding protein
VTHTIVHRQSPDRRGIEHVHDRPLLAWSDDDALRLVTRTAHWTVPSGGVAWLPAWTRFGLESTRVVTCRFLFIDPEASRAVGRPAAVLEADALLRALLKHLAAASPRDRAAPEHGRLLGVLLDRIVAARALPLTVRGVSSSPLGRILADARQAVAPRIDALAVEMGVSRRTVERTFQRDTGMSAGRWRQQVRFTTAIRLLAEGLPVHQVAGDVGYRSASAFVAAFRREMGTTPKRFVERGR